METVRCLGNHSTVNRISLSSSSNSIFKRSYLVFILLVFSYYNLRIKFLLTNIACNPMFLVHVFLQIIFRGKPFLAFTTSFSFMFTSNMNFRIINSPNSTDRCDKLHVQNVSCRKYLASVSINNCKLSFSELDPPLMRMIQSPLRLLARPPRRIQFTRRHQHRCPFLSVNIVLHGRYLQFTRLSQHRCPFLSVDIVLHGRDFGVTSHFQIILSPR